MDICYSTNQELTPSSNMCVFQIEDNKCKDVNHLQGCNQFHMEDLLSLNVPTQEDEMLLEFESKTGDQINEQSWSSNSSMLNASDFIEEIKRDSIRLSKEIESEYKYDNSAIPFDVCVEANAKIKEYGLDGSEKHSPHSIRKENFINEDDSEQFQYSDNKYQFEVLSPKDKNVTKVKKILDPLKKFPFYKNIILIFYFKKYNYILYYKKFHYATL